MSGSIVCDLVQRYTIAQAAHCFFTKARLIYPTTTRSVLCPPNSTPKHFRYPLVYSEYLFTVRLVAIRLVAIRLLLAEGYRRSSSYGQPVKLVLLQNRLL